MSVGIRVRATVNKILHLFQFSIAAVHINTNYKFSIYEYD